MARLKNETVEEYRERNRAYKRANVSRDREYQRKYREKNYDRVVARQREYQPRYVEANRDRIRGVTRARYTATRELIAAKAVEKRQRVRLERLERLGNPDECEICCSVQRLVIDHDHLLAAELKVAGLSAFGADRGVLCTACNNGIGSIERGGLGRGLPDWPEIGYEYLRQKSKGGSK